jgi:hypothetical protein
MSDLWATIQQLRGNDSEETVINDKVANSSDVGSVVDSLGSISAADA